MSPDPKIKIFGKLESVNPTGSVKDRAARSLIQTAEKEGLIKPGDTILEPTSGNTGLGLAMIGRIKGYNVKVVMPASVPPERVHLLEAFGAEVILSHKDKGTNESILVAKQLAEENPSYYMPFQYGNLANPRAHYTTTGPEIARDMPDVNAFVAGLGTGGTLMGVGKALSEHNPDIEIIATAPHPDDKVQGLRSIEHGFIPPILDLDKLDGRILVDGEEAFYWTSLESRRERRSPRLVRSLKNGRKRAVKARLFVCSPMVVGSTFQPEFMVKISSSSNRKSKARPGGSRLAAQVLVNRVIITTLNRFLIEGRFLCRKHVLSQRLVFFV